VNHPEFRQFLLTELAHRYDVAAARPHLDGGSPKAPNTHEAEVSLRLCTVHDDAALERLAVLEARPLPRGRFVVAEVNGELVAAQPLAGGRAFADPFRPTAELLPLMRLRARQIAGADRRLGFLPRAWSLVRE